MSPELARIRDIPSLAWIQARAFTRRHTKTSGTPGDRDIPATLVLPLFLMATFEARAAGGLYHHNQQVTAYAKPPRISWRILGARAASCLLVVLVFIGAGTLAERIHPTGPLILLGMVMLWLLIVVGLLGTRSFTRAGRAAEKTLANYVRAHRATVLVNIARAEKTPEGTGLCFTQQLTAHLLEEGHTVALIAATPKHQGLYAEAGYTPIENNLAMATGDPNE